jgi:hypothetical protein
MTTVRSATASGSLETTRLPFLRITATWSTALIMGSYTAEIVRLPLLACVSPASRFALGFHRRVPVGLLAY